MQSVSSRVWTRVAVFISYDDNHYTTGTSTVLLLLYICVFVLCGLPMYACSIFLFFEKYQTEY